MTQQILYVNTSELSPNGYNPNIMPQDTFDLLKRDIQNNGIDQPIIVKQTSPNKYEIIDGEHRWKACSELGIEKVPIVIKSLDLKTSRINTINMDYIHGENDTYKLGAAINKLKEKYSQSEITEKLGFKEEQVFNIEQVCAIPASEETKLQKFSVKLPQETYDKLQTLLSKKDQETIAEKFISVLADYEGV